MSNNERYVIRRLLDGLSGWLTYIQATGAKTLYCEHFLYPPIHDIAKGRDWLVRAQQPVKSSSQRIDFVIFRRPKKNVEPGLVFIEVKYLTNINKSVELQRLADDFEKLRALSAESLRDAGDMSVCGPASKFVLVIGQHSNLELISKSTSKRYQPIIKLLRLALKDNPPRSVYRSVVETKLKSELHWNVIAFGERSWPKLAASGKP